MSKTYSHSGPSNHVGIGLVQHQCSGFAVLFGCRRGENDRNEAKIRGVSCCDCSLAFSLPLAELPKFLCYASVLSLCVDASYTLLPGLICNLPVHAGRFRVCIILGMKESTGQCMHACMQVVHLKPLLFE